MDLFSVATGIAGLLSLSIELTKLIGSYINGVKHSSKSVEELLKKLGALSQVLGRFADFLKTENIKGGSFDQSSTLFFATNACKDRLQSIFDKLDEHTKAEGYSRGLVMLKWPFTEAENLRAMEALHGYIEIFHFSLTIEGCTLLSKTSTEVSEKLEEVLEVVDKCPKLSEIIEISQKYTAILKIVAADVSENFSYISRTVGSIDKNFQNSEREKEIARKKEYREKVLSSLSPLAFRDRHHAIKSLRQSDTGKWFFETKEFKEWSRGDKNSALWCPGIPGAGKTVMTSFIVDHLADSYSTQNIGIAYVYCDYKDTNVQSSINLFSSLTQQLARQLPDLPPIVEDFHESLRSQYQTIEDHLKLIVSLSQMFESTFLLVDALDEVSDAGDFQDWKLLLSAVEGAESPIRLLVTSRPHLDGIKRIFGASPQVAISASSGDVRTYITSRIANDHNLANFTTKDPTLKEEIFRAVNDKVDGMFLLARFQMDRLENQTTARKVRTALLDMSTKLIDTYDDTISRIEGQCKEKRELAMRVLGWISHARRPLTSQELRYALAVEPGDDRLDETGLPDVELLIGVCWGLVYLEAESDTIRLVHYTVQEYFSAHDKLFPDVEADISLICLTHLCLTDNLDIGGINDLQSLQRYFENDPFLAYASGNWDSHLRGNPESRLLNLTLQFVGNLGIAPTGFPSQFYNQLYFTREEWLEYRWRIGIPPLHFAASAGLNDALHTLIREAADINILDYQGDTPLMHAARGGHMVSVKLLLGNGANSTIRSKQGGTAFHRANENGHKKVAALLLAHMNSSILGRPWRESEGTGTSAALSTTTPEPSNQAATQQWYFFSTIYNIIRRRF